MLCADATGDHAAAERETAAVGALAKLALSQAGESQTGRPARVLRPADARAVIITAGLSGRYGYYPEWRIYRYMPIVVAAWDEERKVERHLSFDYLDATTRILRNPESKYPFFRSSVAKGLLDATRDANHGEATDAVAWREARESDDPAAKRDIARRGATAGGVMSARYWLMLCERANAPANCADGFVDTLLPHAEENLGYPTMLLAWAYANGVGVEKDAAIADKLLDRADAHWSNMGASVAYAQLWFDLHDEPLPASLAARLARAEAAGNENATLMRLRATLAENETAALTDKDIAFLERRSQNGRGDGFAMLADWAEAKKDKAAYARWLKQAADAGDPDAQAHEAFRIAYAADGPHDEAAGLRLFEEAAQGGSAFAGRMLSYKAMAANDGAAAERWLLDGVLNAEDQFAAIDLALLYDRKMPGTSPDGNAAGIFKALQIDSPAEARRTLAIGFMRDGITPKDPVRARALLESDAKAGDHDSEALLGTSLLNGRLGPADETEGTRWAERALAGDSDSITADYGYWLFYKKGTDASRAKALEVWHKGVRNKDEGAANNLAWAYCTAPVDSFRDGKAGMKVVKEMGAIEDLNWGYVDTVAACRAASGDFAGAVELQKKVVNQWQQQIAGYANASAEIVKQSREVQERLALYEAKKIYIEPVEAQQE
jgi:TPR repeat protein